MEILNNSFQFFIMRKKIAIVGLIILMLGIALFIAGFETVERAPTYTTVIHINNDEYTTACFTYHSGDVVVITGVNNDSGLICNSYINNVTQKNIHNYTIIPEKSSPDAFYYDNLKPGGRYVFVEFSSSRPVIGYSISSQSEVSLLSIAVYLSGAGIILGIIGFITAIAGIILKKKPETKFILNKKK
ncbi:hypothetical protein SAMN02745355_0500 [Picrophilus oshimae DSM 9789]|uniref:Uncharacterized protein n=2 Tax=Picrophilus oshimae TaxID=46632 RepID=A0A8G2L760_PICTO|nr:hypothetical protein SAMN02745355_0500 [Picrophilus oshimae DSM 9789]